MQRDLGYANQASMTDLALTEPLLNPLTGELVTRQDLPAIGSSLEMLKEHKRNVDQAIAAFTEVVVEESHRQGTKTLNVGKFILEVSADSEIVWDVTELVKLRGLGLPEERYAQLVTEVLSYKIDGRVAKQLEGSNEGYARVIQAARTRQPKRQYVSVKTV